MSTSAGVLGGGLEGAERTARETALWSPSMGSPDQIINRVKPMADARGRDMVLNDGPTHGAVATHRDSIVGSHYRLNANPSIKVLSKMNKSFDEVWAKEMKEASEARFELLGESDSHWLDASRMNTVTGLARMAVGGFCIGGEVLATAEWLNKDRSRPLKTAIQMISSSRLSNPNGESDSRTLKRGVVKDINGRPLGYWIRMSHPGEQYDADAWTWKYVPVQKPWGRLQVLHILEQFEPDQTRGVADMVAALKHMRMTKTLDETTLQQAVIQASYAAALESDLPPDVVYGMMGGDTGMDNFSNALGAYMTLLKQFFGGASNVAVDGAKMPVLPPGVKMTTKALGTPGGVGDDFGASLQRHTATALGLSYEEFTKDYSKVSYASMRGGIQNTNKFMKSRKKMVADRTANFVYGLYLEEDIALGNIPLPRGVGRDFFYEPLAKEALSRATWIGAGAGQIDELKETQAALLRIKAGLSTYEKEISRFGDDWREVFAQRAREDGLISELDLQFALDPKNTTTNQGDNQGDNQSGGVDAVPPAKPVKGKTK